MRHKREPRRLKETILLKKRQEKELEAIRQRSISEELREIHKNCSRMVYLLYVLNLEDWFGATLTERKLVQYWKQNRKNKRG